MPNWTLGQGWHVLVALGVSHAPLTIVGLDAPRAFDFINADFLSVTGATCVDGVNFMTRFSMMSLLPLVALLMGLALYLKGRSKQIKTDTEALKSTAHEMFVMIDEDHSGTVDPDGYRQTFKHFDSTCDSSMHEGQFYTQLTMMDKKQLLNVVNFSKKLGQICLENFVNCQNQEKIKKY